MRKLTVLLMIILTILTIAGCGNKTTSTNTAPNQESSFIPEDYEGPLLGKWQAETGDDGGCFFFKADNTLDFYPVASSDFFRTGPFSDDGTKLTYKLNELDGTLVHNYTISGDALEISFGEYSIKYKRVG